MSVPGNGYCALTAGDGTLPKYQEVRRPMATAHPRALPPEHCPAPKRADAAAAADAQMFCTHSPFCLAHRMTFFSPSAAPAHGDLAPPSASLPGCVRFRVSLPPFALRRGVPLDSAAAPAASDGVLGQDCLARGLGMYYTHWLFLAHNRKRRVRNLGHSAVPPPSSPLCRSPRSPGSK